MSRVGCTSVAGPVITQHYPPSFIPSSVVEVEVVVVVVVVVGEEGFFSVPL